MGRSKKQAPDVEETGIHQKEYSDDGLWKKIASYANKVGGEGIFAVLLLYYLLQDEHIPMTHKAMIMGTLGYFIMPLDIIPDALLGIGFTDDIAALMAAIRMLKDSITPTHIEYASQRYKTWFPNSKVPSLAELLK